jgi:hypothetical protein
MINQTLSQQSLHSGNIRQELLLTKRQVQDMRTTNMTLKNEKLKAEHERNLVEIRAK